MWQRYIRSEFLGDIEEFTGDIGHWDISIQKGLSPS